MKIFKIAIICISMVTMFSTMSFADTGDNGTEGGDGFTIVDTTGTGNGVDFTPSPTTLVGWSTLANTYAVTTVSAKTNADNGKQYGVLSGTSPIFESGVNVATDGTVSLDAPTISSSLPSPTNGTWTDKAGNTPPAGS